MLFSMKRIYKYILFGACVLSLPSCKDDYLELTPPLLVKEEQVWNDPLLITNLLANLYDRLPLNASITNTGEFHALDEASWSGNNDGGNTITSYGFDRWRLWDYNLIREINIGIENIDKYSTKLTEVQKKEFKAEFRFLRAFTYFEHVKRMGGVPIITSVLSFNLGEDPTLLQQPRAKEADVYDYIASELDAIKNELGNASLSVPSNTRATKYTALALKSRAMLYAASIAKYNSALTPGLVTPGGEVGIPASRADEYYAKSLEASEELITTGVFSLYRGNSNLGENFFEAITKKSGNREVIWARDFLTAKDKRHSFAYDNIARGIREDNLSSSNITPVLNLVEDYEYVDGSEGDLRNRTADNSDYIYYDNLQDIFANKDARLYGTVIFPGSPFKGSVVQIQAGVKVWNGTSFGNVEGNLGSVYTDGKLLTGSSGPHKTLTEVSNTGFYMRKFVDSGDKTSTRGIRSDVWWVRFRYAEVLLNASEAALELGLMPTALKYVNQIRARAGFTSDLTTLTLARLQNERRVELAFEDHRIWDLKRWRIAHQVWNGDVNNPNATLWALYPYRIVRPGHPTHDKYVFDKIKAPRVPGTVARNFRQEGNYYATIDQTVLNNNPKLVRNPGQ
jgi:starch-binding outer membrane protein, SusD/RagB family